MKFFRSFFLFLVALTFFFFQEIKSTNAQTLTARPNVSMAPNTYGYYEYLPLGYNPQSSQKYPLLIAFGGLSQNGDGSSAQLDYVFSNWGGPGWQIQNGKFPSSFTVNGQQFRYIVILPQFKSGASPANVDQVITYLLSHYQADPNRVYITGNSSGGGYCWDYPGASTQYSQRIAATIPTCAASSYTLSKAQNIAATNLPVWATHNDHDPTVSVNNTINFVNGINNLASPPTPRARMSIFQEASHNCADSTFNPVSGVHTSTGLNIYEWLLTNTRSTSTACNAPSGLTTSSITSAGANISWGSVSGSNNYDVEYKATSSSTWISVVSGSTTTSASLSGLAASTSYDWRVRSNCSSGSSSFSSTQFTTLASAVCNSPAGLTTSSITTSTANISWSSATGANSYDVEYKATSSSSWISRVSGTTSTYANFTGLAASTSYDWRVRSNCSSGSSSFSSTQFITLATQACNSPAGLTTSSITSSSANISWSSVTGANSYDVEYKATSSSTWISRVSGTTSSSTNLTGLVASTSYDWRVRSNCSSGSSSFSSTQFTSVATSACNSPTGLTTSSIRSTSGNISWSSATGSNSYDVEYKATNSSIWISRLSGTDATTGNLTGLASSTSYDWRVRSNCSSGSSSFSSTQFTTLASAGCNSPAGLNTSSITTGSANISWSGVTGANNYDVEYKITSASTWISVASGITATSASLSGLASSTFYDWRVRSNCSSGSSNFSSTQFITLAPATCNSPAGLTTSSITSKSANISWSSATGANSYNVDYKATSSSTWINVASGSTATSTSLSGLNSSTSYDWRVKSNCLSGSSSFSSVTFSTASSGTCNAPTGLIASPSPTTGYVSWTAVSGANSYDVDYKATSSSTWINVATNVRGVYSILSNLAYSTSYDWRVRTNCASGSSAYGTGQFSTAAASGCIDPTGLLSSVTTNSANFSWNSANGSTSYKVEYRATNSGKWITAVSSTTATAITLSGLSTATDYDWRVRSFCSAGSSGYSLAQFTTLTGIGCSDQLEPNNSYTTAAGVSTGVNINAQISSNADNDYYRFNNIPGQSNIKVTLKNLPLNYDLQLYTANGIVAGTSQNTGTMNDSVILNTANTGSYVVRVYSPSGTFSSSQCYTLNIQIGNTNFSAVHPASPGSFVTDVTAVTLQGGLRVYPVPASSSLTASFDAYKKGTVDLIIVNPLGQQVMRKTIGVDDGINTTTLDVSKITPGMYFLKVINGKDVQMKKLMIKR